MSANPLDESDPAHQQRIRERAYRLWEEDGCPEGRDLEYWDRAKFLVGIEENPGAGQIPPEAKHDVIEEAEIQDNLGEFPDRFADQGEWRQTPIARHSERVTEENTPPPARGEAP
jgi:hypothetical protein